MRRAFTFMGRTLAGGMLAALVSCTAPQTEAPQTPAAQPPRAAPLRSRLRINPAKLAKALHARINGERRRRGLPTYRWDAALGRIAAKHSRDMAKRGYFGHRSPDGIGPAQRYLNEHYACGVTVNGVLRTGAEVIYRHDAEEAAEVRMGEEILRRAIGSWTANDGDRSMLLSPHWQREGAGIFVHPDGTVLITVNFC